MYADLGYPTKKQADIWLQRRNDHSVSDIAKNLKISRPMVSKAYRIARERIEKLLIHTAGTFRIEVDFISPEFGFAVGHGSGDDSRTYITYTPDLGVQVWFSHIGECDRCDSETRCSEYLKQLAIAWEIDFDERKPPTEMGIEIFSIIMRRLEWGE